MTDQMDDSPENRARIFFSYSRKDSAFAKQLADDLRKHGAAVWIDTEDIAGGRPWDKAIEQAMKITKTTLVILSPSSADSDNVRDEIDLALRDKDRIIPVLYRECEVPLQLRRIQYIDFTRDDDYASALSRLVRSCATEAHVGASPAIAAAPLVKDSLQPVAVRTKSWASRGRVPYGLAAAALVVSLAIGGAVWMHGSASSTAPAGTLDVQNDLKQQIEEKYAEQYGAITSLDCGGNQFLQNQADQSYDCTVEFASRANDPQTFTLGFKADGAPDLDSIQLAGSPQPQHDTEAPARRGRATRYPSENQRPDPDVANPYPGEAEPSPTDQAPEPATTVPNQEQQEAPAYPAQ